MRPTVGSAVSGVMSTFDLAGWHPKSILVLTRSTGGFWAELSRALDQLAACSTLQLEPTESAHVRLETRPPLPGELLVVHDAPGGDLDPAGANIERELARMGVLIAHIEYPTSDSPLLIEAYLSALSSPVERMEALAPKGDLPVLEIVAADNLVLTVRGRPRLFTDLSVLSGSSFQILQFPLGEAWFIVEDCALHGEVLLSGAARVAVHDGVLVGWEHLGKIVEIGVGTNANAAPISSVLGEKAKGRVHLGFGDSELIGGSRAASFHGDLYLSSDSMLRSR